jgi:hypothetical protein
LKREFCFFSIELYAEEACDVRHADLFDTLISTARRMEKVVEEPKNAEGEDEPEKDAKMNEEEDGEKTENDKENEEKDEEKEVANEHDSGSMTAAERKLAATRRNQTRRDAEGDGVTCKWCNLGEQAARRISQMWCRSWHLWPTCAMQGVLDLQLFK